MAVEDIVDVQNSKRLIKPWLVPVINGEALAAQINPRGNGYGSGNPHRVKIGSEPIVTWVGVAPNEGAGYADQFVEHVHPADVATVDGVADVGGSKQFDRPPHKAMSSVAIG